MTAHPFVIYSRNNTAHCRSFAETLDCLKYDTVAVCLSQQHPIAYLPQPQDGVQKIHAYTFSDGASDPYKKL